MCIRDRPGAQLTRTEQDMYGRLAGEGWGGMPPWSREDLPDGSVKFTNPGPAEARATEAAVVPTGPQPGGVAPGGFRTAKGSEYEVHADGTTTRNKAARSLSLIHISEPTRLLSIS